MYSTKPAINVGRMLLHRTALQCRRKRSSATPTNAKVVNDVHHGRGDYSRVTDADVRHFQSLLGEPNVLTGALNVGPYNVDYMKHASGNDNNCIIVYCRLQLLLLCIKVVVVTFEGLSDIELYRLKPKCENKTLIACKS